ncbi:MAG: B12-binding domain-containing radical SAM protein [Bacillota bacterium]
MKVLLINISLRPTSPTLLPPLGLAYIATAIHNAGYGLEILDIDAHRYTDNEVESMIREKDYDVAAMGCIVTGYKEVKKLCSMIKRYKNVPVIVGNSVASSIPELLLERTEADIAVIGEGDITDIEVLKALEKKEDLANVKGIYYKKDGKIYKTPVREAIKDIDSIPFINWDLFDIDIYIEKSRIYMNEPYPVPYEELRSLPVNTARGCAFNCTFCYHVFKKDKYRVRSPRSVCEEMKLLKEKYGINYVNLFDELTFYSRKQCEEFADTLLKYDLGVFWKACCRGNLFKEEDIDLARKLKKAGCVGLGYSLESANGEILKAMNKKLDRNEFVEQTRVLRKAGLAVWTSLVVGYPQENEETLKETFDCCYDADIYPSVGYLVPLPGTPMYEYARKTGAIKDEEEYLLNSGDRQDFRINLTKLDHRSIEEIVKRNLKRISDKLELGLDEEKLLKTGNYKHKSLGLARR